MDIKRVSEKIARTVLQTYFRTDETGFKNIESIILEKTEKVLVKILDEKK